MEREGVVVKHRTINYSAILLEGSGFARSEGTTQVNGEGYRVALEHLVSKLQRRGKPSEVDIMSEGEMVARYLDPRQSTLALVPDGDWDIQPEGVLVGNDGDRQTFYPWASKPQYDLIR